jgi:hypothetical protein
MRSVPLLGEHNWDVLGPSLGLTTGSFAQLESSGAIGTHPLGKLPKTFQVPLALDQLNDDGLLLRRPGARSTLIATFGNAADNGRPKG